MTRSGAKRSQRHGPSFRSSARFFGYLALGLTGGGVPAVALVQALGSGELRIGAVAGWLLRRAGRPVPALPHPGAALGVALSGLLLLLALRTGVSRRLAARARRSADPPAARPAQPRAATGRPARTDPAPRPAWTAAAGPGPPRSGRTQPADARPARTGPCHCPDRLEPVVNRPEWTDPAAARTGRTQRTGRPACTDPIVSRPQWTQAARQAGTEPAAGWPGWTGPDTGTPVRTGSAGDRAHRSEPAGPRALRSGSAAGRDGRPGVRRAARPPASWPAPIGTVITVTSITGTVGRTTLAGRPRTVCSTGPRLHPGAPYVVLAEDDDVLVVATPAASGGSAAQA